MAMFAPVAPPAILRTLKQEDLLGTYHLLLAHDVVAHPFAYYSIFAGTGSFIILDHSLIELGKPVTLETMVTAAKAIPTSVVVLPDHLRQMRQTVKESTEAAELWSKERLGPFMAVPQGANFAEICTSAHHLKDLPDVNCWGVPRDFVDLLGTRLQVVRYLKGLVDHFTIHLLGFSDNIIDDIRCAPYAEGIDSAMPIRVGLQGLRIEDCLESHPPRGDYWESDGKIDNLTRTNLLTARRWFD